MCRSLYAAYTPTWEGCWLQSSSVHQQDEDHETPWFSNILSFQKHLSSKKCQAFRFKTHAHTKQVWPILYFKNKLIQFSKYTLTHVFLVMAKSHCTCTYIKSSKKYCVLYVKNIARLQKCLHIMMIWDMRKSL